MSPEQRFALFSITKILIDISAGKGNMILIVDDHQDSCDVLMRLLKLAGHEDVECVYSGEDALSYVRTARKPDLMVLDHMMPGMTGLDVLRELKAEPDLRDVPVVFYSADSTGRAAFTARMLGAKAWMTKGGTEWPEIIETIDAIADDCLTS